MDMTIKLICVILFLGILESCSSDATKEPTLEEKRAEIYYNQGSNELYNKEYAKALINLIKARELNPLDSKIRTNLGMTFYFKEKKDLAINELKEAIKLDPQNGDALLDIGTIYLEMDRLEDARFHLEKVLTLLTYNGLFRAHYNMAIYHLKKGDRKSAFASLNNSIKEKEDYCSAHFKLGELYTEEFRFKEAQLAFSESTKGTCVNDPTPHYYLALAYLNLHQNEKAQLKLQYLISKFPKSQFKILAEKRLRAINHEAQRETLSRQTETIDSELNSNATTPQF